jgi:3-deoxy-D-arabino-heptulosonate 7-phosphate (DAHP) synthase
MLRAAADRHGLLVVSEVMDHHADPPPWSASMPISCKSAPATCRTYNLLRELGRQRKPVLLKRGISATIEEYAAVRRTYTGRRQLRT